MEDEPLILKIPLGPFGEVNLTALWRRVRATPKPESVVAKRFLQAFREHGVLPTQIQRFLPEIALDRLESDAALLGALSGDVLDRTSELFGVRREWLEGADGEIYPYRSCYKDPDRFFEDLAAIDRDAYAFPVRALYCGTGPKSSPNIREIVLVLVEKVGQIGEDDVCRYRVYSDGWDWGYGPARIQLKAMARIFYMRFRTPVPMYRVAPAELAAVRERRKVPGNALSGPHMTEPSLEDFGLAYGSDIPAGESLVAKEAEELPFVLKYVAEFRPGPAGGEAH